MDTAVRNTTGLVEEFAKFAHEAVDALRERGVELEGNIGKLMTDTKAFGLKFGEGTKFGDYIENNPSKAALYSFMTGLMFTHFMKSRGINFSFDVPGATEKGEASKPRSTKAKAA